MRLQAVRSQDVGDAATGAADRPGEQPRRPAAPPGWRGRQRQLRDPLDDRGWNGMVATPRLRLSLEPVDTRLHEPSPHPRHRDRREVELHRDVDPAGPCGTQQNHAGAPHHVGRRSSSSDQRLQLLLLLAGDSHEGSMRHPQTRSHALTLCQRRCTSEALPIGYGRIAAASRATRMAASVIGRGLAEIRATAQGTAPALWLTRSRRPGGGRKKATDKDPIYWPTCGRWSSRRRAAIRSAACSGPPGVTPSRRRPRPAGPSDEHEDGGAPAEGSGLPPPRES